MTRPNPFVLFAGHPAIAPWLFFALFCIAFSWQAVPWWVCIASAVLALRIIGAFFQRRRYKRWMREWKRMAAPVSEVSKPKTTPATAERAAKTSKMLPVQCLLPKPRNSPSRQEIEANLPESVARLIRDSREREKEMKAG